MLSKILPLIDVRVLTWLRWKQFKDDAVYWLRVLGGYDPTARSLLQNIYVLYLLAIVGFWLFTMWAFAVDTARTIGSNVSPGDFDSLLEALPLAVLIVQIWSMVMALRSTPLKLSFADMAYVAGSPIARSVPVLLAFIRQVALRTVLFGALWVLLSIALLAPLVEVTMGHALIVIAIVFLLTVMTWAVAWLLGILRLVYPQVSRIPLIWLTPLLLLGVYYLFPDAVLWPGRAVILVIYNQAPFWLIALMIGLAVLMVAAFVALGSRINMIQAVDESRVHARLAALGLMAWRMPGVQFRIRVQESTAGSKPRWQLPVAYGPTALMTRSAVSFVRHPILLLGNLVWGAAMTYIVVLILVNNLPVQLWIGWLIVAGVLPPVGLLHTFQMDVQERFLRQFLPINGWQIFLADVGLPLLFVIGGAIAVWVWQPLPPDVIVQGFIFIPLSSMVLALCGAYALNTSRVLQRRLLAVGLSFGLAIVASVWLKTPVAGLVVLVVAIMFLAGLLMQEA